VFPDDNESDACLREAVICGVVEMGIENVVLQRFMHPLDEAPTALLAELIDVFQQEEPGLRFPDKPSEL
jgi:hypothetical protein